ncbi:MAG: phage resistance protein [Mycobacteriales bacterium]
MSDLLRDVIDIPERTGAEDYVLRLTEGIDDSNIRRTLDDYVVTPALVDSFDRALDLVSGALRDRTSRGAFLSGSFGSGKSHFMAVLHALLRGQPDARALTELQGVVAAHDPGLQGKKVLPLAYHLLGAPSMEEALLGGYVRTIRTLHPEAPLPSVHEDQRLLADGERQRQVLGDERFFAELNAGASSDPWSKVLGAGSWDVLRYDEARAAEPGTAARQQLVSVLVDRFFTSYTDQAGYLDLDRGLAAITAHAQSLGYDAVVMFLDELVLWLAFGVQDREFFRKEAPKLTKLVESAVPRSIPLISFIARQLDLSRWFADAGASGAEQEALDRAFRHQEGRFTTIVLGDDNLPYVAHQRLLRPRTEAAAARLADAFAGLERRPDVWDVLLDGVHTNEQHRGADEAAFRLTYPFSPALVSTLRSLAGYMQRERTALKVMQQMLVDRRDQLTVDDVIPVGDAFDYVVQGKQALDEVVTSRFRAATGLWTNKLEPLVARKHGLAPGTEPPPGYLTDARLAKTLLLSGIAPEVPALKELTASRLASLNHGTITAPIAGREAALVLGTVREWAGSVPEISVGDDPRNPVIRVRLADVDYESVVDKVRGEDNDGRRRELLRELVRDAFGVADRTPDMYGAIAHTVVWRGSRREVDLVFGNVRDGAWLTEDHFRARPGTWRFVVDHPFDDSGHSASEDLRRVDDLRDGGLSTSTVVWLPRFLAPDRMQELSRLVKLEWVLGGAGDRWTAAAQHLSEGDRVAARAILESQRGALRERLRAVVQQAYGAAAVTPGTLVDDPAHDRVFVSLDRSFDAAKPVGADLRSAFADIVDRAFASSAPGHPRFEPVASEVTAKELVTLLRYVDLALGDPEARVLVETADRAAVRRLAGPLGVGRSGETHFLFGDDQLTPWAAEFEKAQAREGVDPSSPVSVTAVRGWIRAVTPALGLRPEVEDVVVLAWAALRQRACYLHGGPVQPKPGALADAVELRPEPLPTAEEFRTATARAQTLFGIVAPPHLTAGSLGRFCELLRVAVQSAGPAPAELPGAVQDMATRLGVAGFPARLATARAAADLLQALGTTGDRVALVRLVATTSLPATEAAVARSISAAPAVLSALRGARLDRYRPLLDSESEDLTARAVLDPLRAALAVDELVQSLPGALGVAEDGLFAWLNGRTSPTPPPPPPPGSATGRLRRAAGQSAAVVLEALQAELAAHPDAAYDITWTRSGGTP